MKQFSNILDIDTRDNKRIIVRLKTKKGKFKEQSVASKKRAQATLPLIDKMLKKANLNLNEIDEIRVERGPGSFTGLRVGISIANALSFALGKKVNGRRLGAIEPPEY